MRKARGLSSRRRGCGRLKADGGIACSYTGLHADIYYGLDAREDDYNLAPPRSDGTLATTARWEQIREGINDLRYATALEKLAADPAARAEMKAAAQALLARALEIGGGGKGDALQQSIAWRTEAQKALSGK